MLVAAQKVTAHSETILPLLITSLLGNDTEALKNRHILEASET